MRQIAPIILFVAFASQSYAQTKRAMTIDDLITSVRVGDPDLSSNGKQVVFTRTTTVLDSGRRNADIWTVPADGSEAPKELIGGEKMEASARFTPDGKHIAFISSRDGAP